MLRKGKKSGKAKVDKTFEHVDWVSGYDPAQEELDETVPSVDELLDPETQSPEARADIAAVLEAERKRSSDDSDQ
jgi:hypothetical protein